MKYSHAGFVAVMIVILVALVVGGGVYIALRQTQAPDTTVLATEVITTPTVATTSNSGPSDGGVGASFTSTSFKLYTHASGLFSMRYPSAWTYSSSDRGVSFNVLPGDTNQVFGITWGTGIEDTKKTLSYSSPAETVVLGGNTFTRFIRPQEPQRGYATYILPIVGSGSSSTYLSILVPASLRQRTELETALASIVVDSSKAEFIVQSQKALLSKVQIEANVRSIYLASDPYLDERGTYVGMCDQNNQTVKEIGIDQFILAIQKLVSSSSITCNTSATDYVYAVRLSTGQYVCADTNGSQVISVTPKALSCK